MLRRIHRIHFYAHTFSLFLRGASTIRIPVFFLFSFGPNTKFIVLNDKCLFSDECSSFTSLSATGTANGAWRAGEHKEMVAGQAVPMQLNELTWEMIVYIYLSGVPRFVNECIDNAEWQHTAWCAMLPQINCIHSREAPINTNNTKSEKRMMRIETSDNCDKQKKMSIWLLVRKAAAHTNVWVHTWLAPI